MMALGIVVLLVGFFLMTRFLGGFGFSVGEFLLISGVIVTIVGGVMGNTKQCHICGLRIESKNLHMHMKDAHGKS